MNKAPPWFVLAKLFLSLPLNQHSSGTTASYETKSKLTLGAEIMLKILAEYSKLSLSLSLWIPL